MTRLTKNENKEKNVKCSEFKKRLIQLSNRRDLLNNKLSQRVVSCLRVVLYSLLVLATRQCHSAKSNVKTLVLILNIIVNIRICFKLKGMIQVPFPYLLLNIMKFAFGELYLKKALFCD